jgi:hypothetical protein
MRHDDLLRRITGCSFALMLAACGGNSAAGTDDAEESKAAVGSDEPARAESSGKDTQREDGTPSAADTESAACASAAACTPEDACHVGLTSCASDGPACEDTGDNAPNGTACGLDRLCDNGSCVEKIRPYPVGCHSNPC